MAAIKISEVKQSLPYCLCYTRVSIPSDQAIAWKKKKTKKLRLTNCIEHDTNCLTAVLCAVVQVEETVFILSLLFLLSRCRHAVYLCLLLGKRIRRRGITWPKRHSKASVVRNEATPVLRLTCIK